MDRTKGRTEGIYILNQALLRGLMSCWLVFGGSDYFSASLLLINFVIDIFLVNPSLDHKWELTGNYPVFIIVMVIYHYIERIGEFLSPPIFS